MTTTVQYDLDTSGGLMDEIQALIAPPQTEEPPTRKYRKLGREGKRTPRTTNRESCDSCREGGDLICCDRCPASFHLQCCNPPLEDEDLPTGDWVCHKCIVAPEHITKTDAEIVAMMPAPKSLSLKDNNKTSNAGNNKKQQGGDYFKPRKTPVRLNDRLRREGKQCMRLAQLQAYKEAQKEMKTSKKEKEKETEKERSPSPDPDEDEELLRTKGNPLLMLIKAASIQNPTEYQLPAEIMTHAPLPGSTRKRRKEDPNRKQFIELENGMVPLPAKLCFHCGRSCRVDPLIQCDYCPLLFHRDCLTPPLTQFPTGRWMCPNHPENGLPEFARASYTEKCRIYHDMNNRLNQHAVKLDFLSKVHATGPPPPWKEKPARRKGSQIPLSIMEHYRNPPPLIPPPSGRPEPSTSSEPCTSSEQEQWLKSVVSLQSSIASHLAQSEVPKSEPVTQKVVSAPQLLKKESDPARYNHVHHRRPENHDGPRSLTNGPILNGPSKMKDSMDWDDDSLLCNDKHSRLDPMWDHAKDLAGSPLKVTTIVVPPSAAHIKKNGKDNKSIASIIAASNMDKSLPLKASSALLQSCLDDPLDGELSQLDDKLVKVLAWQRLQQLIPSKLSPPASSKGRTSSGLASSPILAVACPASGEGPTADMRRTCFTIGNSSDADLYLGYYGHCNYISAKHACIFYERASRHFELLNYSEFGSRVDSVLYSGKVKTKRNHNKKKHHHRAEAKKQKTEVATAKVSPNRTSCVCETKTGVNGWEGTASLRHGGHLQFGCLEFIFSIAETAEEPAS